MTSNPPSSRPYTDLAIPSHSPVTISSQSNPPARPLRSNLRSALKQSPPTPPNHTTSFTNHTTTLNPPSSSSSSSLSKPEPTHDNPYHQAPNSISFNTSHVRFKTEPVSSSSSPSSLLTSTPRPQPTNPPSQSQPPSASSSPRNSQIHIQPPSSQPHLNLHPHSHSQSQIPLPLPPQLGPAPTLSAHRDPPLMVALAGWPEPVFVGQVRDRERDWRRSQPDSPPFSPSSTTATGSLTSSTTALTNSGISALGMSPLTSTAGKSNNSSTSLDMIPSQTQINTYTSIRPPSPSKSRSKSPARTRSPSFPSAGATSGHYNSHSHSFNVLNHSQSNTQSHGYHSRFADPRIGNSVVGAGKDKMLPVAPAWSIGKFTPTVVQPLTSDVRKSSSSTSTSASDEEKVIVDQPTSVTDTLTNVKSGGMGNTDHSSSAVYRAERTPVLVTHRAVPEVWPPFSPGSGPGEVSSGAGQRIGAQMGVQRGQRLRRKSESALRNES